MHILVINPYLVGGYSVGGAKRIYRMIRHFAREADVSFASFADPQSIENVWRSEIHDICRRVVTVPLEATGPLTKAVNFFRPEPASVHFYRSPQLQSLIAELVEKENIDFVHVEFFDMAPQAWSLSRHIPRVLVSQEVTSLAKRCSRRLSDRIKEAVQTPKYRLFEKRAAQLFDRVYCITEQERCYLESLGVTNCHIYSHVVDTTEFTPSDPMLEDEGALLFLGNFDHRPNCDALQWFLEDVFPHVRRQNSAAVLHVVGPNLDRSFLRGLDMTNVTVHGEVACLQEFYDKAAIFVNPIISGGGMRGKVLEAMAKAKAIVSTSLGVQGIQCDGSAAITLAEEPSEFAAAVVGLLGNREMRRELGRNARSDVCRHHDESGVFATLLSEYRQLMEEKS